MANDKERLFWISKKNEIIFNPKCKARPPRGKQTVKVWSEGKGLIVQSKPISLEDEELFAY